VVDGGILLGEGCCICYYKLVILVMVRPNVTPGPVYRFLLGLGLDTVIFGIFYTSDILATLSCPGSARSSALLYCVYRDLLSGLSFMPDDGRGGLPLNFVVVFTMFY